jgi:Zn-dependent protease
MITIILTVLGFAGFIYSIIIHEMAHGFIADRLGDPTARLSGRLTLNPVPHIDPMMSILFPALLIFSGSPIVFGAAKPVPIDPYNLRNPRKDMGLIGLAGPVSNLILAGVFALLAHLLAGQGLIVLSLLASLTRINLVLAIFNLIPIPPLDGGRVLTALLPPEQARGLASLERFGLLIVIFLLLFPTPLFSLPGVVSSLVYSIFILIFP